MKIAWTKIAKTQKKGKRTKHGLEKVYISSGGVSCGAGKSLDGLWDALLGNVSAIREIRHFDVSQIVYKNAAWQEGLWNEAIPSKTLKLAEEALSFVPTVPPGTTIIWTGVKGSAEYLETGRSGIPAVPSDYARIVRERTGTDGPFYTINAACASSTAGISFGAELIRQKKARSVLVVAADVVSRFIHFGFSSLMALTEEVSRPFDVGRSGLNLGDGGAAVLLVGRELLQEGYPVLAELAGWSTANDANHITGPARDGCGLVLAMENALRMAGIDAGDVGCFCAHGTSTRYNDAMELTAVERVFGGRKFPMFSVKGATGHTLGAAGALETLVCTKVLKEKTVPPTVGLREPEEWGVGRVSSDAQIPQSEYVMTSNSGFGGVNAVLIVKEASA